MISERGLPPAWHGKRHVLIVDDHEALADNLREVLSDDGTIDVTIRGSSRHALEHAAAQGFDVAIVDVKLPDGSGIELLPDLRELVPEGEVILITGFATIDAAMAALRGGAFALLLKSFRPEELRTTVEQALVKVALRRERDWLERRYRALVEVADVIVLGLDPECRVRLANPKFSAMTGVDGASAHGADVSESWISEADRARFREAVADVASRGAPRELEAGFAVGAAGLAGGDARTVRFHLSSEAADDHARERLVFAIGVDVTERRALERRAANAEALSTMGTLALGLAHEIRNPLNAAVLQMHLLGKQVEREVASEAARASMRDRVQIVVGEIKRLARLLGEFLELARPRSLAQEPVVIGEVLDAVIELHAAEASARGIGAWRVDEGPGIPPVLGDREKLRQVFLNLFVNALDATETGGAVRLVTRVRGDRVVVEVRDDGKGIAEADLGRLFDPFFTTKPGGTGLGLSIVRKILEQHGGSVSLRSKPAAGTTVEVDLPAANDASRW
jgi:PAS domain S-box-containing protein